MKYHPIFRIYPGYVRSQEAVDSLAGLKVTDVDAVIAKEQDIRSKEIACSLSHAKALRTFLETSAPFAVILEDDAILGRNKAWLGFKDFDLFIPYAKNRAEEPPVAIIRLGHLPIHGSFAYLASRRFAEAYAIFLEHGGIADHANHEASQGMKIGSFMGNVVRHDHNATSMISEARRKWFLSMKKTLNTSSNA